MSGSLPTNSSDTLVGTNGNDVIALMAGNDLYTGLGGNDCMDGEGGDDTLSGDDGNDQIVGGSGNDSIDGGNGIDLLNYYLNTNLQSISVDLGAGRANDGLGGTDTIVRIEYVQAGAGNDTIIGGVGADTIWGGWGNDSVVGGAGEDLIRPQQGDDTVLSGEGNDRLSIYSNAGRDSIDGGNGLDVLVIEHFSGNPNVTIDLATGRATDELGNTHTLAGIENVEGSYTSETIIGDSRDNQLSGGDGNDNVTGGNGNDSLYGGNGADTLADGGGNDIVDAGFGFGIDIIDYSANTNSHAVSIDLGAGRASDGRGGTDTIAGIENVWGGAGNDTIVGSNGAESFWGNSGDDCLIGGSGLDIALYEFNASSEAISVNLFIGRGSDGRGGTDTLSGMEGVYGSTGNDSIIGDDGNNRLSGGAGSDSLVGGNGLDLASYYPNASSEAISVNLSIGRAADGRGGADTLSSIELIWGGSGDDTIIGADGAESFWGNRGNDSLFGGAGADTLDGVYGNDTIIAGDGNDRITGGIGDDSIVGGNGVDGIDFSYDIADASPDLIVKGPVSVDLLLGRARDERGSIDTLIGIENVFGTGSNDTIIGNSGDNYLYGGGGNDSLIGGAGNDRLEFTAVGSTVVGGDGFDWFDVRTWGDVYDGFGSASIDGGPGSDYISFDFYPLTIEFYIDLSLGIATDKLGGSYTLAGIENTLGTRGNDTIIGDSADNVLGGFFGDDMIISGGGNDRFDIHSNAGNKNINGGNGIDTLVFNSSYTSIQAIVVDLAVGRASDEFGNTHTLAGIENVEGDRGNDTIIGGNGAESFRGNSGNDSLVGGAGADTLDGGNGDETIIAGDGNDRIIAGWGSDSIDAGGGTFDVIRFSSTGAEAIAATVTSIGGASGYNYATAATASQGADTIINFEYLNGSANGDSFVINGAAISSVSLFIFGNNGNDTIISNVEAASGVNQGAIFADYDSYSVATPSVGFTRGVSVDLQISTDSLGRPTGLATDFAGIDSLVGVTAVAGSVLDDTILGTAFDDRLRGYAGNDLIDGRGGFDIVDYGTNSSTQGISVDLISQRAFDGRGGNDTLISIEHVRGGSGNDTIAGGNGNETIWGGNGADQLSGGAGNDSILSAGGNDLLLGGAGDDVILTGTVTLGDIYALFGP